MVSSFLKRGGRVLATTPLFRGGGGAAHRHQFLYSRTYSKSPLLLGPVTLSVDKRIKNLAAQVATGFSEMKTSVTAGFKKTDELLLRLEKIGTALALGLSAVSMSMIFSFYLISEHAKAQADKFFPRPEETKSFPKEETKSKTKEEVKLFTVTDLEG